MGYTGDGAGRLPQYTDHQGGYPTVPTLVIDGGESPAYMHHGTQALADVLPHARRRTLEGEDHGAAREVVAPVLVEFFIVQQA